VIIRGDCGCCARGKCKWYGAIANGCLACGWLLKDIVRSSSDSRTCIGQETSLLCCWSPFCCSYGWATKVHSFVVTHTTSSDLFDQHQGGSPSGAELILFIPVWRDWSWTQRHDNTYHTCAVRHQVLWKSRNQRNQSKSVSVSKSPNFPSSLFF
jgi:hypothetical protein